MGNWSWNPSVHAVTHLTRIIFAISVINAADAEIYSARIRPL
jgi:hypothetical protein